MNRLRGATLIAFLAASLVPWLGGGNAGAQDEPTGTVIALSSMPAKDNRGKDLKGQYWVMAVLTTADGRYVAGRSIQIVEPVDFFGKREANLGTAVTDGTGLAAVIYQPSREGEHKIFARFGGDKQYAASKADVVAAAADVVAPFPEEPMALASVGTWLSVFLGFLGVAFWAVLLSVLGRTAWRIKTAPGAGSVRTPAAGSRGVEEPI